MALVPHTSPMARVLRMDKLSRPPVVAAAVEVRVQAAAAVAVLRVLHALRQPKTPQAAVLLTVGSEQVALLRVLTRPPLLAAAAVEEEAAVAEAVALPPPLSMLRAAPQVQSGATLPLPWMARQPSIPWRWRCRLCLPLRLAACLPSRPSLPAPPRRRLRAPAAVAVVAGEGADNQAAAGAVDTSLLRLQLLLVLLVGPMGLGARKAVRALAQAPLGLGRLTTIRAIRAIITTSMSRRAQRVRGAAAGTATRTMATATTTTATPLTVAAGRAQRRARAPALAQGAPLVPLLAAESAAVPAAGRQLRRRPPPRPWRSGTWRAAVCPSA